MKATVGLKRDMSRVKDGYRMGSILCKLALQYAGYSFGLLTPSLVLRLDSMPISSDPLMGQGSAYPTPEATASYVTLWSRTALCWESGEEVLVDILTQS